MKKMELLRLKILDCEQLLDIITRYINERKHLEKDGKTYKLVDLDVIPTEFKGNVSNNEIKLNVSEILLIFKYQLEEVDCDS